MTDKPQDILFKDKTIHVYGTLEDMDGILCTLSNMELREDVKIYFNNELYFPSGLKNDTQTIMMPLMQHDPNIEYAPYKEPKPDDDSCFIYEFGKLEQIAPGAWSQSLSCKTHEKGNPKCFLTTKEIKNHGEFKSIDINDQPADEAIGFLPYIKSPKEEPKLELAPLGDGDFKLVDTTKLKPGDEFYELCHDSLVERIKRRFKKEKKD